MQLVCDIIAIVAVIITAIALMGIVILIPRSNILYRRQFPYGFDAFDKSVSIMTILFYICVFSGIVALVAWEVGQFFPVPS